MTMQVGMVGTDGIVIASDTQWTYNPILRTNQVWAGGRHHANTEKIRISHKRGIAVSMARSMETADAVARRIISDLKDEEFVCPNRAIEQIGDAIAPSINRQERNDAQCLVGLAVPTPQLFHFQFALIDGKYGSMCQKMHRYAIAGDTTNSAIFWANKYYDLSPIEQLVPLAAQLIIAAHDLNTATISGLEVVLCDASGIRRLSDESIHQLERQAHAWDKGIREQFSNYRGRFTYAPRERE